MSVAGNFENRKPLLAEPVTIAKFWKSPRNHTAHVRVDLSEHRGYPLINVRVWQTGSDGIDRPTTKGIALTIDKLPELQAAITKALAKAKELGLLSDQDEAGQ
jgi:hypothetical protein